MWARPPQSSWRVTAGQVQVCKQTPEQTGVVDLIASSIHPSYHHVTCKKNSHAYDCSCSLQVSMSSVMAALARCPTPVPLCIASVCHPPRRAFFSFPWALQIPTSALHYKSMYSAGVLLTRALPSPTLRGPQASTWAAAGSEQALLAPNRPDQDLCRQVNQISSSLIENNHSCSYRNHAAVVTKQLNMYFSA